MNIKSQVLIWSGHLVRWMFIALLDNCQSNAQAPAPTVTSELLELSNQIKDASDSHADDRTDLRISGIYPHLTTYGVYSQNGAHEKTGHNECGIGAIVPWAGKLWVVNYAPHKPQGSEHKLFSIDPDLSRPIAIHPESVGGTPAGRMIHAESNQLLIGHHLVDSQGHVRTISPAVMPMRVTAIARHLSDPANKVYYIDMEGAIWEANVHSLQVERLFKKPVPGWHSKGGYTSQGRLVVSNNGELAVGDYRDLLVGGKPRDAEERGVLADWDGQQWRIIERRQYTEVTGPNHLAGGGDSDDLIWAIGWDRRSLRLKVCERGEWFTYLLPKAAFCNDASHGWYTEWPRIRPIDDGRWLMDMHGMFFEFPPTFSHTNSKGIVPIASHLRYIPDFCHWNGQLVLASNDTSIQENPLAGQPQSNLWFGDDSELSHWGPASAYGGPWIRDLVRANQFSDPFLIAGFARRILHLQVTQSPEPVTVQLQIDVQGNNQWTDWRQFTLKPDESTSFIFPEAFAATWLRLSVDRDCEATAYLHLTSDRFHDGSAAENKTLFDGLADVENDEVFDTQFFPAQHNRNLRVIAQHDQTKVDTFFEFTKSQFNFEPAIPDAKLKERLTAKPVFDVDAASVRIQHGGQTLRLPKGHERMDRPFENGWPRSVREVISERQLANIHGTFYEVPLVINGQPPAWNLVRPIASHRKRISDYASWNGLLVLGGVRNDATDDGHVFVDPQAHTGLWFGGIDDLWRLGKPIGDGGPWLKTPVKAGEVSDAYLMTGYDKKTVKLSHESKQPVTIRLEIDVTGTGVWMAYQSFVVPSREVLTQQFPVGFSANWIRAACDQEAQVTVLFEYR